MGLSKAGHTYKGNACGGGVFRLGLGFGVGSKVGAFILVL
jgi:hypothetical protein